jgi:dethiobiotin synthetase
VNPPKRFFVTGTDTGAGKTFVTAGIARRARALAKKVFGFKPIETGCEMVNGRLVGPDQEIVSSAAGDWQQGELRGLYQLVHPLAPLVASQKESIQIDVDRIVAVSKSVSDAEVVLVEGAGGWRVPITEEHDMSELAKRLDAEVVIAARAGLGTINHSLLTIEAVERDGLKVAALILSRRPDEDLEFARSNGDQIRRRWNGGAVIMFDTDPTVFDALI